MNNIIVAVSQLTRFAAIKYQEHSQTRMQHTKDLAEIGLEQLRNVVRRDMHNMYLVLVEGEHLSLQYINSFPFFSICS